MQKFGNWGISDQGIEWLKKPAYLIPVHNLADEDTGRNKGMYQILLHMTEKNWLSKNDLYNLNTAFVFALEHFGLGFSSHLSLAKTFLKQESLMDKRNDIPIEDIMLGGGD